MQKSLDARLFKLRSAFEPLQGLNNKAGSVQTERARKKSFGSQAGSKTAGTQSHSSGSPVFQYEDNREEPIKRSPFQQQNLNSLSFLL